jgi:hypothetical protein
MKYIKPKPKNEVVDLNDELRTKLPMLPPPHKFVITEGVSSLPEEKLMELIEAVKEFSDFTEPDDPYGEHDFISVLLDNNTYFMKIDYYDKNME